MLNSERMGLNPKEADSRSAQAPADIVDRMNKPAVAYAAGQGNAGVLDALFGAGIDVNATYEHSLTAPMWVSGQGQLDAVKLLLERES